MGLLDFFRKKEERADAESAGAECADVLLRAIITGSEIDEETAMSVPALAGCINFIADTVAALPIKLYRDCAVHQTAEEISGDPRISLLNDDSRDLMNVYEVKKAAVRDMLLHGAGYLHIQRGFNAVLGLRYVDRRAVNVSVNSDPIYKEADINVNGRKYYPWDFVILTRGSKNGVTGVGLLKQINDLLAAMRDEMLYESSIARSGGNKKGFLQSEKKLSQLAIDELKRAWRELYANNGDNMMVLNDGIKYQQAASTSVEMQLNEHKLTNSEMIAMCCGLNTAVISGKAGTEEYISAVRTSAIPVVEAFQAALNKSLLLESEKKELYFVLDTTELLRSDVSSRFNAYSVALQNNIMSIDEVRYRENLPPLNFNYMKLSLADVLYDPVSGQLITPNMGVTQDTSELTHGSPRDIMEERKKTNYAQDPRNGKMMGSVPMGVRMSKGEYRKIVSEINTNYGKYQGEKNCIHFSLWKDKYYSYKFINYGFDNYKFTKKRRE